MHSSDSEAPLNTTLTVISETRLSVRELIAVVSGQCLRPVRQVVVGDVPLFHVESELTFVLAEKSLRGIIERVKAAIRMAKGPAAKISDHIFQIAE
jgi:hypothetical protein